MKERKSFNGRVPEPVRSAPKQQIFSMGKSERKVETDVFLNLYDLHQNNNYFHAFGMGVFHSGVEVNSVEYSYGGHPGESTGVFSIRPRTAQEGPFREQILLGKTSFSSQEIDSIITELKAKFRGCDYNVVSNNCNHFSDALAKKLLGGKGIPGYVNRAAKMGSFFKGFFPGNQDPNQQQQQQQQEQEQFSAFSGSGRTLSGGDDNNSKVNSSKANKMAAPSTNKNKSSSSDKNSNKNNSTSSSASSSSSSTPTPSSVPDEDPAARRERILKATMARLGNQQSQQ